MHSRSIEHWQHHHAFLGERHEHHEKRTWLVVALTTAMMVAKITRDYLLGGESKLTRLTLTNQNVLVPGFHAWSRALSA